MNTVNRRLLDADYLALAPESEIRAKELYTKELSFDNNMVLIIAALLCALIFALGMNWLIQCVLQCSSGNTVIAKGLNKDTLQQIPVATFGAAKAAIQATECPICLGEFEDGDKVRVLPRCNHEFHVRCIDKWLLSRSSCPNCRHSLLESKAAAAAAEQQV